jgi:3-hydroxyacyl-CoA dehydrogenase/enoyl-CoA hydratase/3-hydroxybutyryl-CoA epimerase
VAPTADQYPAPGAILDAVAAGLSGGMQRGLDAAARSFAELVESPQSHQLVNLFLATRELTGTAAAIPSPGRELSRPRLGVVGAGFMGSGIAAAALLAGHRVTVIDTDPAALDRCRDFVRDRIEGRLAQHRISATEGSAVAGALETHDSIVGLERADVIVEAVFEDLDLKRGLLREIEAAAPAGALIGSNTSTLPIAQLASVLSQPERLVGLHFFSPVHRMKLVEVVRPEGAAEDAVERAAALARGLAKAPIVVADGPGFYTTRILSPYLAQGAAMMEERLPIAEIDRAGRAAGFPVGPLELIDEVGIDVAAKAGATLRAAFPERAMAPEVLEKMVEAGRLGRKSGRGFYLYRKGDKTPDEGLHREIFGWPGVSAPREVEELAERLLLAMAVEAVRCLEQGILSCPRDGDVGAVLGLGFPPFRGGPFRFFDDLGAEVAVRRLDRLAEAHGGAFDCPESLRRMARGRSRFHPGEL